MQRKRLDSVDRVKHFIAESHIPTELKFLALECTRTSFLASQSLGCTLSEIAKTIGFLHFVTPTNIHPILVTLSGDKQVSLDKLARYLETTSSSMRKMSADEVKTFTGYSIGGVPPFPHDRSVRVLADDSLFRFEKVWSVAGSSNTVMSLKPFYLIQLGIVRASLSQ